MRQREKRHEPASYPDPRSWRMGARPMGGRRREMGSFCVGDNIMEHRFIVQFWVSFLISASLAAAAIFIAVATRH